MSSVIRFDPTRIAPVQTRTVPSAMDLHTVAESYRELARPVMADKVRTGRIEPKVAVELYRRAMAIVEDPRFDSALRIEALSVASAADEFIPEEN